MKFTHHPRGVEDLWVFDPCRRYEQPKVPSTYTKPNGLWLSVDDDWRRWCEENWSWPFDQTHEFTVDLAACAVLESPEAIDTFTDLFAGDRSAPWSAESIDWAAVCHRYAGIVIAPYQWSRRNFGGASWYYPWDAASACIWDLSVVTEVAAEVSR